jgi:hypothetical protein
MILLRSRPAQESALALLCGTSLALLLDRPWVAAATVVCFLLPDWGASLIHAWRFPEDLAVALDPLAPDPELLASAFRSAAAQATASGSPVTLGLRPLYISDGRAVPLMVTLDAKRKVRCWAGDRISTGFTAHDWLPRHPLPIRIGESPVSIRFSVDPDKRLTTHMLHSFTAAPVLAIHAGLCAALIPCSGPATLAAAAALLLRRACLRSGMDA